MSHNTSSKIHITATMKMDNNFNFRFNHRLLNTIDITKHIEIKHYSNYPVFDSMFYLFALQLLFSVIPKYISQFNRATCLFCNEIKIRNGSYWYNLYKVNKKAHCNRHRTLQQ